MYAPEWEVWARVDDLGAVGASAGLGVKEKPSTVLRYSNFAAWLDILLVNVVRGGAAHVRELGIARNPSCVRFLRAETSNGDAMALLSVVAFLHNRDIG